LAKRPKQSIVGTYCSARDDKAPIKNNEVDSLVSVSQLGHVGSLPLIDK
jgi:hypothetical protein